MCSKRNEDNKKHSGIHRCYTCRLAALRRGLTISYPAHARAGGLDGAGYHNRQFIVLSKFRESYDRGEVILFDCESLGCTLLKRVAACGGDTVEIKDGSLYVNRRRSRDIPI